MGEHSLEKWSFCVGEPSLEKVPPRPLQEHLNAWLGAKSFARPPVLMQAPAELGPMSQFALASLVSLDITIFNCPSPCGVILSVADN